MKNIFADKVLMAPMAGITDKPMRQIVRQESPKHSVVVSEMVAINALSRKNAKTYRIADVRDEKYDVIVQLVGADPKLFADAAQLAQELGAAGIDINMGCPVRKIISSGAGSALLQNTALAAKIIESTVQAVNLPVSVKFRKGWDAATAKPAEFAKMCEGSGAAFLTVHGRTKTQGYTGKADWQAIAAVKKAVQIPVIGNGDVVDGASAKKMLEETGADAVMVGRAALGAPWLLDEIGQYLKGKPFHTPDVAQIKQILVRHMGLLKEYYGEKLALPLSRKYVCWYCKSLRDAKRFRENYMKITDFEAAFAAVEAFFDKAKEYEA